MAKTQNPTTLIVQACAALAQISQQLSTAVSLMNGEGDPSPFAAPEKKKPGRPPATAKAAAKEPVKFTAAEIEKIKFLMDTGTEKQDAMRKVFNLRGGSKAPAKTSAKPTVKVAPKKKAIRMITREDVENDTYKLSEFTAHLKENGIEKDSEDWTSLKNKFLELRRKYKEEIEEESTVAEEPEMTDDEQLMGEFATDGDDGGFDFSE